MPHRDHWEVVSPERVMSLSIVEVHVAKLGNVQVTQIVLVILVPGDVAGPIWRRHSAAYNDNL